MSTRDLRSAALCALAISLSGTTAVSAQVALPNLQFGSTAGAQLVMMTPDDVVNFLKQTGYEILSVETTFLRRKIITATNGDGIREIVVTRSTGEVLYDVLIDEDGIVTRSGRNSVFDDEGNFIQRDTNGDAPYANAPAATDVADADETENDVEGDSVKKAKKDLPDGTGIGKSNSKNKKNGKNRDDENYDEGEDQ